MTPRWRLPGAVYVYRTRKPGALLGLPLLGRHTAYVGQTRNLSARHQEHMNGGGRYGQEAKPWADLSPRRYVVFRMRHCPQWVLNTVEVALIRLLCPVYNVAHNRGNPRRITPRRAKRQRLSRNTIGWSPYVTLGHLLGLLLAGVLVLMVWRGVQS